MSSKYQLEADFVKQTDIVTDSRAGDFLSQKEVVAAVVTCQGKIALLKRSHKVTGDKGRWHCITGFLPPGAEPETHARTEVVEETGISPCQLVPQGSSRLVLKDKHGQPWRIHGFHYESLTRKIATNWESADARWSHLYDIKSLITVDWLANVMDSLDIDLYLKHFDPATSDS